MKRRKLSPCDPCLTPAERLAHYTRIDPLSGCHIWHGSINHAGYGKLNVRGKSLAAHRLAWALKHGPIPAGMILCHRCDVRRCCNPDHLVLGTRGDNMADHKAKRLAVHAARAATGPDSARIYILYRGLELSGRGRGPADRRRAAGQGGRGMRREIVPSDTPGSGESAYNRAAILPQDAVTLT